jgi:hypothetical protein
MRESPGYTRASETARLNVGNSTLQAYNMKFFGILILVVGLALSVFALNMSVNVDVASRDLGYGVRIPAMSVANVNLMEQRQNLLIISGVLAVVGAILTGFASMLPAAPAPVPVILKEGEGLLDFLNEKPAMKTAQKTDDS